MRTLYKILVGTGITLAVLYIVAIGITLVFPGKVIDLPDHKLVISGSGFYLYPKVITYTYEFNKASE